MCAAITQTGKTVVAETVGAQPLAVSQSVVVPISAVYNGTNRIPTAVTLNGTDCQTKAPATTATTDPTHTATTTSTEAKSKSPSSASSGKGGDGGDGKGKDGTGHGGHGHGGDSDGQSGED